MQLEQTLRAAFAPRGPGADFEDVVMARVSAAAWRSSQGTRRKSSRAILVGTILVVAAAAAMLTIKLLTASEPQVVVVASPPIPAPELVVAEPAPPVAAVPIIKEETAPPLAAPVVKPFTVRVLPLQNDATKAAAQSAVNRFFEAMLEDLRGVPGLTLIGPEAVAPPAEGTLVYQLKLGGSEAGSDDEYRDSMEVVTIDPDQKVPNESLRPRTIIEGGGAIAPSCAGGARYDLSCSDPASEAAYYVRMLRTQVFPPDASLRQQLQAELRNPAADPRRRLSALTDLASWKVTLAGGRASPWSASSMLREAAVIQGAINLATTAVNPGQRMQVWRIMRGVSAPVLSQALIVASREERDGNVRAEIVATLARDASGDPTIRAALEQVAKEDTHSLVRAIAQRAISGEATWKQYIVSSLKDANRSDVERIEAMFFDLNIPTLLDAGGYSARNSSSTFALLDYEGLQALAEVLPRAARESRAISNGAVMLLYSMGSIDHPAITKLLLDAATGDGQGIPRAVAASQLQWRIADPEVRSALEKMAADDSDVQLQEIAATMLKAHPAQAPQEP